jgi:hypothetical protein
MTLLGSFLTLYTTKLGSLVLKITSWDIRADAGGQAIPSGLVPDNGAPLVLGATILLSAALLGLVANALPARLGIGRANILLAAAGAAFLAGTTFSLGMQELSWMELFAPRVVQSEDVRGTIGPGFWLLVVATVIALASPVLAWLPAQARPERDEPETPPFGTPVAVVHRLPDAPPDEAN